MRHVKTREAISRHFLHNAQRELYRERFLLRTGIDLKILLDACKHWRAEMRDEDK